MELISKGSIQHLAGIVPLASPPLDFEMPWHDSLMPIAPDYLAVERAVYECATAGCETIWVVCHMKFEPLLKKRMGNFITDPVSLNKYDKNRLRSIPIYYVPIHPRDKNKRDCLGWSVMYGANIAHYVSRKISSWLVPEKFYCAFPYGICDIGTIKKSRLLISGKNKVIFKYNNLSFKDNIHTSFTFDANDYFSCKNILKQKDIDEWLKKDNKPINYNLKTALSGVDTTNSEVINLQWFYDISNWENYRNYISSEHCKTQKSKHKLFYYVNNKLPNYDLIDEDTEQNIIT
jgi:hypothetical protein